jgi:hypothetical protein
MQKIPNITIRNQPVTMNFALRYMNNMTSFQKKCKEMRKNEKNRSHTTETAAFRVSSRPVYELRTLNSELFFEKTKPILTFENNAKLL